MIDKLITYITQPRSVLQMMPSFRVFLRFGVVGVVGFIVDVAVLYSVSGLIGLFYGRAASFFSAVFATWVLNRLWTFSHRRSGLSGNREFAVYLALMLLGGAINYSVYAWLIVFNQLTLQYPILGVAAGSLAGLFVNLATSRFVLFKRRVE